MLKAQLQMAFADVKEMQQQTLDRQAENSAPIDFYQVIKTIRPAHPQDIGYLRFCSRCMQAYEVQEILTALLSCVSRNYLQTIKRKNCRKLSPAKMRSKH